MLALEIIIKTVLPFVCTYIILESLYRLYKKGYSDGVKSCELSKKCVSEDDSKEILD